ncbi:MAG: Gfo/Idh/MocA family oxidoreductase, partial [Parasporobacterium sp.]|nr:Gfo/Idh/MocA family oxidoreductase [Parasporobacterium sp.]
MHNKTKIVVCGARFGQFYLEAIKNAPEFELVGIYARGSDLAVSVAKYYKTNLITDIDEVCKKADLVCIAVKTGVLGGKGTELALEFLNKKIAVVLEQPVHSSDLTKCYKAARKNNTAFHVGNLYLNLPQVRRFIDISKKLMEKQNVCYINADMATQLSYPFTRILTEIFGKNRELKTYSDSHHKGIFSNVTLEWDNKVINVRAQNEEGSTVADNCMHVLFQLVMGTPEGNLTLTDPNGALLWRSRMKIPNATYVPGDLKNISDLSMESDPVKLISKDHGDYAHILSDIWTGAVTEDIKKTDEMRKSENSTKLMAKEGTIELSSATCWSEFSKAVGYPVKIDDSPVSEESFENIYSDYLVSLPAK